MYYDLFRRDKYEWNTRGFSKDIFEILRNKIKTNEINELLVLKNLLE
ncbi:hypothetical protein DF16_pBMB400orf00299 (plasmid) [Bacillus thuringiensis serovar kurstaki str. YBT-1520]|nr:hypothetical protein DF16_pBMB400orf00299 [Bacillus thuringiensis serovar kurstaki str. YBT-1520]